MVFAVDVFILGSIIFLGAAYFYIIWDCAKRDFILVIECEKRNARIQKDFMKAVSEQHPENEKLKALHEEYSEGCSEMQECKI